MTDTTAPVAFPQSRTCPYQPPAACDPLRGERPLTRITLFDGREAWLNRATRSRGCWNSP